MVWDADIWNPDEQKGFEIEIEWVYSNGKNKIVCRETF